MNLESQSNFANVFNKQQQDFLALFPHHFQEHGKTLCLYSIKDNLIQRSNVNSHILNLIPHVVVSKFPLRIQLKSQFGEFFTELPTCPHFQCRYLCKRWEPCKMQLPVWLLGLIGLTKCFSLQLFW